MLYVKEKGGFDMAIDPATMMAVASALSSVIGGITGKKGEHGSTYNKNQLGMIDQVLNQLSGMRGNTDITQNQNYQQGQNWLQGLFNDQDFFNRFEAPIRRDFEEQTVPGLANRFAGMGSGGALGSTAFRNQLGREGSNLATNIAALRGNMQQGAIPQLMGYAQQPTSNFMSLLNSVMSPTQNTYQGPTQGFMGGLAAPFAQGAATIWGQQAGQKAGQGGNYSPMMDQGSGSGAGWDSQFRQMGVY